MLPDLWLIGTGPMAVNYYKVIKALGAEVTVVGRGVESARKFQEATGQAVVTGGLTKYLASTYSLPDAAIDSVGIEDLSSTAIQLLQAGVRRLLVEKPAALNTADIHALHLVTTEAGAEVFVAYNRRFYASTLQAKRLIKKDGGILSCNFEFTEWGHEIEELTKGAGVKEKWFLGNSTHVVDLAFHLTGKPNQMSCYTAGSLPWHKSALVFAGAGVTDRGVPFSYQANWGAPGRWGLEVLTAHYRLIFRPMEKLQMIRKGSVMVEDVEINDMLDKNYKPGLYEQVRHFLDGKCESLCSLDEQVLNWPYYCKMAGYR